MAHSPPGFPPPLFSRERQQAAQPSRPTGGNSPLSFSSLADRWVPLARACHLQPPPISSRADSVRVTVTSRRAATPFRVEPSPPSAPINTPHPPPLSPTPRTPPTPPGCPSFASRARRRCRCSPSRPGEVDHLVPFFLSLSPPLVTTELMDISVFPIVHQVVTFAIVWISSVSSGMSAS